MTDIADAMILKQLLTEMFGNNMRLVMTSNRHPTALYHNGIQRQSFLPCIELIMKNMEIIPLSTEQDYRKCGDWDNEIKVIDQFKEDELLQLFTLLVSQTGSIVSPTKISTFGREIIIPMSAGSIAYMTFTDLCSTPRSAADYLAICKEFDLFFVDSVGQMNFSMREEARRFITFIDIAYDNRLPIVLNLNMSPENLFRLNLDKRQKTTNVKHVASELVCTETEIVKETTIAIID